MSGDAKLREYLKRVLTDLRSSNKRLREIEQDAADPVVVVGMGCLAAGWGWGVRRICGVWWRGAWMRCRGFRWIGGGRGICLMLIRVRLGSRMCVRGGSWRGRVIFMRGFSGCRRGRRWRWIRSSVFSLEVCWEALESGGD